MIICIGMKTRRKPGPAPDHERDKRVYELRKKGLTYREISILTKENIKNVYMRYKRALVSYPQVDA
jgi:hypothetical protein